jgi:hypothetical protein
VKQGSGWNGRQALTDQHARPISMAGGRKAAAGERRGIMARLVGVHGVGKQVLGEQSLLRDWWPALGDGLTRADADLVLAGDVAMAFYGDLFRPQGELLAIGDPFYLRRAARARLTALSSLTLGGSSALVGVGRGV